MSTTRDERAYRRDPAAKRERLMAAAKTLFSEQGFDATSTAQVAKAAGVSEGILFHHFGSKKGLFESLAQEFSRAAAEATMPEAPELTEARIVNGAFDFADANSALYDMLAKGSGELSESEVRAQSQVLIEAISARLQRAMAQDQIRHGNPMIMAELQFAVVDAAYKAWRRSGDDTARQTYIDEAVSCMQAMLMPPSQ